MSLIVDILGYTYEIIKEGIRVDDIILLIGLPRSRSHLMNSIQSQIKDHTCSLLPSVDEPAISELLEEERREDELLHLTGLE